MENIKNYFIFTNPHVNYLFKKPLRFRRTVFVLFLALAIPLTIFILKQTTQTKQQAANNMAIGFNVRGIINYGKNDILPYTYASEVDLNLSEIKRMGGTIIRVFVANKNITDGEAAKRLDEFLTKASSYNISVIPCLIDFYKSGYYPQGMDNYYIGSNLLNYDFFNNGYKDRYETFVKTVVNYNKSHQNIYAWEVGNELKYDSQPDIFVNFMKDITGVIKNLDPNHNIATGMLNAAHTALTPDELYPQLPNVDIITIHPYNGDRAGDEDVAYAIAHGKTVIAEELGFSGTNNRILNYTDELTHWKNLGVNAVMQWGFIAKQVNRDNGDGDKILGMDTLWHTDYDLLFNLFKSYGCSSGNCDSIPTSTPTFTLTPTPTTGIEPTQTPTTANTDTFLSLNLNLSGIGGNGGNSNPVNKQREITVCIYESTVNASNDPDCLNSIIKKTGSINYNQSTGSFENSSFDIGQLNNSSVKLYNLFVKTDKYLRKEVAKLITITSEQTTNIQKTILTSGDINGDNNIGILDYNTYISCYGTKANTSSCISKSAVDLNDDGKTDSISDMSDFKLFFSGLLIQQGD